jgi:hypothetical protein
MCATKPEMGVKKDPSMNGGYSHCTCFGADPSAHSHWYKDLFLTDLNQLVASTLWSTCDGPTFICRCWNWLPRFYLPMLGIVERMVAA